MTVSVTRIYLIVLPKSTAAVWGITIDSEVVNEMKMQKYDRHKEHYERAEGIIYSLDNLYRKSLQDKIFDRKEYDSLCDYFEKLHK